MEKEHQVDAVCVLYVTAPDTPTAMSLARALIEARAAACVNILGGISAVYRWNGAIEEAGEVALLVKTTNARVGEARALIIANHPYDTPAIVAAPIDEAASSPAFIAWIREATVS